MDRPRFLQGRRLPGSAKAQAPAQIASDAAMQISLADRRTPGFDRNARCQTRPACSGPVYGDEDRTCRTHSLETTAVAAHGLDRSIVDERNTAAGMALFP